jgi:hypothetical protein
LTSVSRQVAAHLPEHDDREQFLAGVNLILAGITTGFEADLIQMPPPLSRGRLVG